MFQFSPSVTEESSALARGRLLPKTKWTLVCRKSYPLRWHNSCLCKLWGKNRKNANRNGTNLDNTYFLRHHHYCVHWFLMSLPNKAPCILVSRNYPPAHRHLQGAEGSESCSTLRNIRWERAPEGRRPRRSGRCRSCLWRGRSQCCWVPGCSWQRGQRRTWRRGPPRLTWGCRPAHTWWRIRRLWAQLPPPCTRENGNVVYSTRHHTNKRREL